MKLALGKRELTATRAHHYLSPSSLTGTYHCDPRLSFFWFECVRYSPMTNMVYRGEHIWRSRKSLSWSSCSPLWGYIIRFGAHKTFVSWAGILKLYTLLCKNRIIIIIIIIIIIGKDTIPFMQGTYTYIPETNHVPKEYNVAAILSLLCMVPISLALALALMYFYIRTFRSMCAVPNIAVFCSSLT
jgi:hypothetical protein